MPSLSRPARRIGFATLMFLCAFPASAQDKNAAADAPRTGAFQLTIPQRSKDSAVAAVISRLGWGTIDVVKNSGAEQDYDLAKETFEVYVPPGYTGKEPYGLLVWVNPGPDGKVHGRWTEVLDKHKLIWIGANKSGNDRAAWVRLGLAIDAAEYMPTAYNIDADRVYVSGASGGGKCSSMLGIAWPDVFTGGSYPMLGCNFYRRVLVSAGGAGKGAEYYRQNFKRPPGRLWDVVTKERRHVFLTGDNDFNRQPSELTFREAKKDGFKHITYLQVPGMGHQPPDAEWFEKGIVALDDKDGGVVVVGAGEPRAGAATAKTARAEAKPAKAEAKPARPAAAQAAPADEGSDVLTPEQEAIRLMKLARLYVGNRMYNKAREKLNQVVRDHPKSPQAQEAQKLLKEIGKG